MKREEIESYIKAKEEYGKYYTIFRKNCMKVIKRFSEIEDELGRSMIDILYSGEQIYMNESKHWGKTPCNFRFYIFDKDTIMVVNETFDIESMFDIKWLMMPENEFIKETQKILDEQKGRINEYDSERTE